MDLHHLRNVRTEENYIKKREKGDPVVLSRVRALLRHRPVTYGSGVSIAYNPWTGWSVAFGFGWSWGSVIAGWGWHYPYPYHYTYYSGRGRRGTTWGRSVGPRWLGGNRAGMSYNSRTGNLAAGQRSAVGNVYTGDYAVRSAGAVTSGRRHLSRS